MISKRIYTKDVANQNMNTIQAKLQECINSGQLNSFDRLSNLFAGKTETDGDDDAMDTNTISMKDESKIPAKKSSTKKHPMTGMYGDKRSTKVAEKKYRKERTAAGSTTPKRGRGASRIESRAKRSSSKKRGKKLATI